MAKDYYKILGVDKAASGDEIKKAFHKLAHKYHPDKQGGDEAKFKEVNEAYQILSNSKRRAEYDTYGQAFSSGGFSDQSGPAWGWDFSGFAGQRGANFEFDLGDIFSEFFGGRGGRTGRRMRRGRDISVDIQIPFIEAIFGSERKILINKIGTCERCNGKGGEPGAVLKKCDRCGGSGQIQETQQSFLGSFTSLKECEQCFGRGEIPEKRCGICAGYGVVKKHEEIQLKIPAGINDGEMIRLTGQGEAIPQGLAGDLYVKIYVEKHPSFRREGNNLATNLDIKLTDALLGAEYKLPALDSEITIKIPAGISSGEILRVRSRGVPRSGGKRGDLMVKIVIKNPTNLSRRAKKLVEELRDEGV